MIQHTICLEPEATAHAIVMIATMATDVVKNGDVTSLRLSSSLVIDVNSNGIVHINEYYAIDKKYGRYHEVFNTTTAIN